MANNRLYLGHEDASICLFLGKTLGEQPWYKAPDSELFELFYDLVYKEAGTRGTNPSGFFIFDETSKEYGAKTTTDTPYIWTIEKYNEGVNNE